MQVAFSHSAKDAVLEPGRLRDLEKSILVPRPDFESWMQKHDWTVHQLARTEYPQGYTSLEEFQLGCICADPYLWCTFFLREPEDPDHEEPYGFWDYQTESLRYPGNVIHKDAAEVGKTREIVAWGLYKAFTVLNGSGLIGAPLQTHLEEIIEAMYDQLTWNPDLGRSLVRWKKHPHHAFYFTNHFKIDFRPSGFDGNAYRGVHARTFAIKDEAVKDKNVKQWSEFWRAIKPACVARIYSVPDGDRSCEFFKLGERAKGIKKEEDTEMSSLKDTAAHVKNMEFKLFQWPKSLMPPPFWTPERKRFYIDQYGGEDSPSYKHNVLGEDGDPENTVFPWEQFKYCIKDIPEYRCLKVLVNESHNEVIVTGYRIEYTNEDGPKGQARYLIDMTYKKSTFFDFDVSAENEFRRLIKSFFISAPGFKRGGGDLGFSGDETELLVKLILGKRERLVARLYLKHVTYDQQCQAVDALDDIYGPQESLYWGTDFGNAGSAVAHDLQGLQIYRHKDYDDRLKGFMFESTMDNIDEDGEPIIDAKTEKPAKITMKELATDILTKKMQHQDLEYPADPDIILDYTNHTAKVGGKHRIYKNEDDHLIDADRVQVLAGLMMVEADDLFSSGTNRR